MGRSKKMRTMRCTVSGIVRDELSHLESYVDRERDKRFAVMLRSGMIVKSKDGIILTTE